MSKISRLPNLDSRSNYKNYKLLLKLIDKVFLGTYLTDQFKTMKVSNDLYFAFEKTSLRFYMSSTKSCKKNPSFRRVLKCIIFQYAKQGRKIKGPTLYSWVWGIIHQVFSTPGEFYTKKSGYFYTREFYTIFSFFVGKILLFFRCRILLV